MDLGIKHQRFWLIGIRRTYHLMLLKERSVLGLQIHGEPLLEKNSIWLLGRCGMLEFLILREKKL
jgi:hypothetical protein